MHLSLGWGIDENLHDKSRIDVMVTDFRPKSTHKMFAASHDWAMGFWAGSQERCWKEIFI